MPVLRQIRERFAEERPFEGVRIAACMHVTTETANLMRALVAGGAEVPLCASNPLSTQDDTAAALVADYGVAVYARQGDRPRRLLPAHRPALDCHPHFVLDDGCDLVTRCTPQRTDLPDGRRRAARRRRPASSGCARWPATARCGSRWWR